MILGIWDLATDCPERGIVGSRDQEVIASIDDRPADRRNLVGGLSRSEYDLGSPLSQRSVVIDAREPKVLERNASQDARELVVRIIDTDGTVTDMFQDRTQLIVTHLLSVVWRVVAARWFDLPTTELYRESASTRIDIVPTPSPETLLLGLYFVVLVSLSVYGVHRFYLVYLYTNYPRPIDDADESVGGRTTDDHLPVVTVQLAIFNEMYVVDRLVEAVSCLDYPRDRLEIQVLDDSTDETIEIARRAVARATTRGFDVRYIHRVDRTGFKAGALAEGLRQARGELIAVFDADFVPSSDFLRRAVEPFRDPRVGMVQARWGHLNRDFSLLTRVQALLLDAHFVLEHGARYRGGLFFNFNGTAGMWRRTAIETAGGWQHDTLTEDLDLSYRAQLAGWRFVFLEDLVAPAEIPVEMNGFKTQQYRWARGSVQTCLKLLPRLMRSPIPRRTKVEAFFHLTAHFHYPALLVLALVMVPALFIRAQADVPSVLWIDLPLFAAATVSMANFHAVSLRAVRRDWISQLRYVPLLMAVGIGLSVNNFLAVVWAQAARRATFIRTPKYGVTQQSDEWRTKRYRRVCSVQPFVELGLGVYFTVAIGYSLSAGLLLPIPFLCLFQFGFLYTALLSLAQQRQEPGWVPAPQFAGDANQPG